MSDKSQNTRDQAISGYPKIIFAIFRREAQKNQAWKSKPSKGFEARTTAMKHNFYYQPCDKRLYCPAGFMEKSISQRNLETSPWM